jgi:hypothetical protein
MSFPRKVLFFWFCPFFWLCSGPALAQTTASQIGGLVLDPQGAAVVGAAVQVFDTATNVRFDTKSDERGEWVVPSLPPSTYRVVVNMQGFQTTTVDNVKLEPGAPATVNVKLTIGSVTQTVEVTSGAELLQTATPAVTTNLEGKQIDQLPMNARNATELLVQLAGTSTPGTSRTSTINGLPKSTLQMTLDGVPMGDQYLRSSDGFFATLMPKPEAVVEVAVTTAGASADLLGQGATQVRFVTKSGTNQYHGSLFWQTRNSDLNSNYYFNNEYGLPRDKIILNQFGGSLGGPILKNKLFFFFNQEWFRLPQTYDSSQLLVPTAAAANGIYTYADSSGVKHQINLYTLAANANASLPAGTRPFATTPDPTMLATLQDMVKLASPSAGSLISRIASAGDYNRNYYIFQCNGNNRRIFPTVHLDWIASSKHHFDVVGNYQKYFANPDAVNGTLPILPGTGSVLGSPETGSSRRITHSIVGALRSAWTPHLTSEMRFASIGGRFDMSNEVSPAMFSLWNGYAPLFGGSYFSTPYTASAATRREVPLNKAEANFTLSHGSHMLTFGGSFTQINYWQNTISTDQIPTITMGLATGDPVNTGTTGIFTAANFPGATPTQRTEAGDLYAILTGRVDAINRTVSLNPATKQYGNQGGVDNTRQRYMGMYLQDSWRVARNLTLSYGVRWDVTFPFEDLAGTYTTSGYAGAWGPSGIGHLFEPGATGGSPTVFNLVKPGQTGYKINDHLFVPSLGLAWSLPESPGPLHWLTGHSGQSVFRASYSISTVQDGMEVTRDVWGNNPGRTASLAVSPTSTPAVFGPAGSVWFRDPTLPALSISAAPTFPIPVSSTNTIYEFDPGLRTPYVQSWSVGLQREIYHDNVLEVRYVGNHAVGLWRKINLNEINIFENGFLQEFEVAQQNLAIAQKSNPNSINFGNQGLPGQGPVPILSTALGTTTDTTYATYLQQGQAGAAAHDIAINSTRMAALVKAGYPQNLFMVNPYVNNPSYLLMNGGNSTYDSLQVILRRRFTSGLSVQGSYVFAKALTNMNASASDDLSQMETLRNPGLAKGASPWDIRNAIKLVYIYQFPFGPGRRWLTHSSNAFVRQALEGWELSGNLNEHSGLPALLRSGRQTVNANSNTNASADPGVVLHNLTVKQLESMVRIQKQPNDLVYFLPPSLVQNSLAAFSEGGILNPSQPYIGPPTTPGVFGERIYLYGPWSSRVDFSLLKRTRIKEKYVLEFRCTALNAFNDVNFLLGGAGNDVNTMTLASTTFGQTTSAYRDFTVSGANDPGGRMIDFMLRFSF